MAKSQSDLIGDDVEFAGADEFGIVDTTSPGLRRPSALLRLPVQESLNEHQMLKIISSGLKDVYGGIRDHRLFK